MQVMSAELLCCAVGDQSLLLSVMSALLYNATNLLTIRMNSATNYDPGGTSLGYPYLANFSFTASVSNYLSVPSLQTVSPLSYTYVLTRLQITMPIYALFS